MSTIHDLQEADVAATAAALGEPDWLLDRRLAAYKAFLDLPWPTVRDEAWRYTDPKRFDLNRPVVATPGAVVHRDRGIIAGAGDNLGGSAAIVDGRVVRAVVCADYQAQGVVVADLSEAATTHEAVVRDTLGSCIGDAEKFDALNLAAFTGGVFVHVPADVETTLPIAISVQAATAGAALPRVLVVVGAHSKATIYVDHSGDVAQTVVEALEVVVGEGAVCHLVTAQDWGPSVDEVGTHRGLVGSNGDYRHFEISLGGGTVYLRPDVRLDRPGANAVLLGVYFGSGEQHAEHRSLIHHNASNTSSELVYKGALQGHSRSTFFGNIRIEPHAKATSSDQTNRNLILTDGARADSIPFLEIECSDVVRCGHHSSVGQVDQLQLFYLESRGIPREEAARMLVFGFFAEVTDRVKLPGVAGVVLGEVESEIRSGPTALMNQKRSPKRSA